jgi:hypothetical protein
MQDVNDDMDELFRRAANGYPLNTGSANWNKVLDALDSSTGLEVNEPIVDKAKHQNKYPGLLLLLILISAPLIFSDYFLNHNRPAPHSQNLTSEIIQDKTSLSSTHSPFKKSNGSSTLIVKTKKKDKTSEQATTNKPLKNDNLNGYKSLLSEVSTNNHEQDKKTIVGGRSSFEKDRSLLAKNVDDEQGPINFRKLKTDSVTRDVTPVAKQNNFKNNFDTGTSSESEQKKNVVKYSGRKHRLYIGLIGGPDISTVKFQSITKTGFSAGVMADYTLGKRLSVETGLLWDKKFYYTDGKYFKPKNISFPQSINIVDVDGNCDMLEWPVNVSYKVKTFRKGFLTTNAGISSYWMKKESYSYSFIRDGAEGEWAYTYKNSSHNLFSVINLAVGYNHTLSNSSFLQVRPYIKIPLSGIGTGRLPITSSGVYIGIFKNIR